MSRTVIPIGLLMGVAPKCDVAISLVAEEEPTVKANAARLEEAGLRVFFLSQQTG
jgi:hypothetical protein